MSPFQPRSFRSRLSALSLVILTGGFIWTGIVSPIWTSYESGRQKIADSARLLAGLRTFIAQAQNIESKTDPTGFDAYRSDFLTGSEDSIIVADLQTRLSALIATRRVELMSARALTPQSRERLDYVGLRLQIRGEMANIQHLIHGIETGKPYLFIDRAAFRLDQPFGASREQSADAIASLSVELDIYGAKWPASFRQAEVKG